LNTTSDSRYDGLKQGAVDIAIRDASSATLDFQAGVRGDRTSVKPGLSADQNLQKIKGKNIESRLPSVPREASYKWRMNQSRCNCK